MILPNPKDLNIKEILFNIYLDSPNVCTPIDELFG